MKRRLVSLLLLTMCFSFTGCTVTIGDKRIENVTSFNDILNAFKEGDKSSEIINNEISYQPETEVLVEQDTETEMNTEVLIETEVQIETEVSTEITNDTQVEEIETESTQLSSTGNSLSMKDIMGMIQEQQKEEMQSAQNEEQQVELEVTPSTESKVEVEVIPGIDRTDYDVVGASSDCIDMTNYPGETITKGDLDGYSITKYDGYNGMLCIDTEYNGDKKRFAILNTETTPVSYEDYMNDMEGTYESLPDNQIIASWKEFYDWYKDELRNLIYLKKVGTEAPTEASLGKMNHSYELLSKGFISKGPANDHLYLYYDINGVTVCYVVDKVIETNISFHDSSDVILQKLDKAYNLINDDDTKLIEKNYYEYHYLDKRWSTDFLEYKNS